MTKYKLTWESPWSIHSKSIVVVGDNELSAFAKAKERFQEPDLRLPDRIEVINAAKPRR